MFAIIIFILLLKIEFYQYELAFLIVVPLVCIGFYEVIFEISGIKCLIEFIKNRGIKA